MGKYDLVEDVLKEFKAEFYFTGARIQPGRPIVFGEAETPVKRQRKRSGTVRAPVPVEVRRVPFFGLPGNPVSTLVTFELFVTPVLRALAGGEPAPLLFASARLKTELRTATGLTRFLPAKLSGGPENIEVEYLSWRGSGDLVCASRANCYLVVPDDREQLNAGEEVSVLIFGTELR